MVCRPAAVQILMPLTIHIASLNRYTPKSSGVPQKLAWCQQFGIQVLPKKGDADFCRLEKAVFRCFFGLNNFSRPDGRISPIACHLFLESLCISGQFWLCGNIFSASYEASEFCWQLAVNSPQHLRPCHIGKCMQWDCISKNLGNLFLFQSSSV